MTTAGEPLLQVRGVKVHFPIKRGLFFDRTVGHVKAVDGVDLSIDRGTTYGLVGESGCGKSTLGRAGHLVRCVHPAPESSPEHRDDRHHRTTELSGPSGARALSVSDSASTTAGEERHG